MRPSSRARPPETYDLTGVKRSRIYTPITVEEVDYDRDGGLKRYGDVTEMQDVVQELTMTQDKAFTLTIDKGNNLDQNLVKNAADMLRLQLKEKSTAGGGQVRIQALRHHGGQHCGKCKADQGEYHQQDCGCVAGT